MLKIKRKQLRLFSVALFLTTTLVANGAVDSKDRISFGVRWWNQATPDEQNGFILGYTDCRKPKVVISISLPDYRAYISSVMEAPHGYHPKYVTSAIAQRWLMSKPSVPRPGGESDPINGLSWAGDAWNTGYVEGFMQCYSIAASRSLVDIYKTDIDNYYASAAHVNDPLASVLSALLRTRKVPTKIKY